MGFFRRIKIKKYSEDEIKKKLEKCLHKVIHHGAIYELEETEAAMEEWAVWREALARKQGENQSLLDD